MHASIFLPPEDIKPVGGREAIRVRHASETAFSRMVVLDIGPVTVSLSLAHARTLCLALFAHLGDLGTSKLPCPTPHPDLNMPGLDAFACQCGASWRKDAPEGATAADALNLNPAGRDEA